MAALAPLTFRGEVHRWPLPPVSSVLLTLRELVRKYPGGELPELDPLEDVGITEPRVARWAGQPLAAHGLELTSAPMCNGMNIVRFTPTPAPTSAAHALPRTLARAVERRREVLRELADNPIQKVGGRPDWPLASLMLPFAALRVACLRLGLRLADAAAA